MKNVLKDNITMDYYGVSEEVANKINEKDLALLYDELEKVYYLYDNLGGDQANGTLEEVIKELNNL